MTDYPQQFPEDLPMMGYATPSPFGKGPLLAKLAGIFNIIMGSLDILYGIFMVVLLAVFGAIPPEELFGGGRGRPGVPVGAPAAPPPMGLVLGFLAGAALLGLVAGVLKLSTGIRLVRAKSNVWGRGLTVGIIGCVQLWCSYFCVFPLAVGVFTIVAMSIEGTRRYLKSLETTPAA